MRPPTAAAAAALALTAATATGAPGPVHGVRAGEERGQGWVRVVLAGPATVTATVVRVVAPGRERMLRRVPGRTLPAGRAVLRLGRLPAGALRVRVRVVDGSGAMAERTVGLRVPVRVTVAAAGDLLLHDSLVARARALGGGRRYDVAPMLAPLRPVVAAADLALCHAETPIGGGPPRGYPLFRAPRALARAIRATGFDACSTASNHTLDGGTAGIAATLAALDAAGVRHTGSAASAAAARRPLVIDVAGVRIGFVAATEHTNGIPSPAPFAVRPAEPGAIAADVRRARRAGARAVVVNVHWGDEYRHAPSPFQRRLAAHLAATPGVTAVVGQHVHVVQPIRFLGRVPVVFGEGNLLAGQFGERQDGLVALLRLEFPPSGPGRVVRVDYVPTHVARPELTVRPLRAADPGERGASWRRTVAVAGRGPRVGPAPPSAAGAWPRRR